jgi:hypothetical protein
MKQSDEVKAKIAASLARRAADRAKHEAYIQFCRTCERMEELMVTEVMLQEEAKDERLD